MKDEATSTQQQLDEFAKYLYAVNELLSQMAAKQSVLSYMLCSLLLEKCLEASNPLNTLADFRRRVVDAFSADCAHVGFLDGKPPEDTRIRDSYLAEIQPILASVEKHLLMLAGAGETVH